MRIFAPCFCAPPFARRRPPSWKCPGTGEFSFWGRLQPGDTARNKYSHRNKEVTTCTTKGSTGTRPSFPPWRPHGLDHGVRSSGRVCPLGGAAPRSKKKKRKNSQSSKTTETWRIFMASDPPAAKVGRNACACASR